jgi:hypothetical protein
MRRRLSLVLHKSRYRGALIEAFMQSLLQPRGDAQTGEQPPGATQA